MGSPIIDVFFTVNGYPFTALVDKQDGEWRWSELDFLQVPADESKSARKHILKNAGLHFDQLIECGYIEKVIKEGWA